MPVVRTPKHDVIVRVPRAIVVADQRQDRSENESHVVGGEKTLAIDRDHVLASKASGSFVEGTLTSTSNDGRSGQRSLSSSSTYAYASQATSTAEWNSLLIWARRQRGPQWDSATGMWQVDQSSTEYYAFGNDPARHTRLSTVAKHSSNSLGSAENRFNSLSGTEAIKDPSHNFSLHGSGASTALASSEHHGEGGGGANSMHTPVSQQHHPQHHLPYSSEDSPPLGPGGRRSRAR